MLSYDNPPQMPSVTDLKRMASERGQSLDDYLSDCIGQAGYMGWRDLRWELERVRSEVT